MKTAGEMGTTRRFVLGHGWEFFEGTPTDQMLMLDAACTDQPGWTYILGLGAVYVSQERRIRILYYRLGELDEHTITNMHAINKEVERELEQERGK